MGWLLSIPGLLSNAFGLASKGIDYYIKKADGDTQMAIALMQADQVRINAQRDITVAGMSHPVWWVMWVAFVLPTAGFYWKCLVWDKMLGWGSTDALAGDISVWAGWIVGSIFCLQIGTGLAGGILNRLTGKR